ncbi:VC1465 family Xer recombination activation factor [Comamonas granuli]|uniref:VC1465 family Xer recombination activation factor n=1 Tax=Comamonas granuli TaxID=290309 RepID=UPI000A033E87|nr:VC1465 family Xer recombination activation factor [Comamonas granuli]
MYRNLGLDLPGCAKLLHVTERTLHNWQSGKHDIPYSAYRLLRLLNRMELPGEAWAGWCFHGGKLWTPEGRSIAGTDSSWWSLLVRRAAMFDELYGRRGARTAAGTQAERGPAAGRAPSALDVSMNARYSAAAPASTALYSAQQLPSNSPVFSAPRLRQAGVVAPPDSPGFGKNHGSTGDGKANAGAGYRAIREA